MSKVRLIGPLTPHQLIAFRSKKRLVYRPCIFKFATFLPNSARNFFVCKQQRRRSASAPAQFYQLSLESMIAKPATCKKKKKKSCRTCVRGSRQFQRVGGGGGGGGGGGVEARRPVINLFYSLQSGSNGFITEGRMGSNFFQGVGVSKETHTTCDFPWGVRTP